VRETRLRSASAGSAAAEAGVDVAGEPVGVDVELELVARVVFGVRPSSLADPVVSPPHGDDTEGFDVDRRGDFIGCIAHVEP
jgi:hypothetical protein